MSFLIYGLLTASGWAALVYQVLWVRELGLLFGSTAQAAAMSIAIFFAGIALGGRLLGERVARSPRPLAFFGYLEAGVALTALGHFVLMDVYLAGYSRWVVLQEAPLWLDNLVKGTMAFSILFPSAFLMGGTLPAMSEHVIRQPDKLGETGSLLYAINTAGGAVGALTAGFVLPELLGFTGAYLCAVGVDALVGICAIGMGTPLKWRVTRVRARRETQANQTSPIPWSIYAVVWISGFSALGVEVVWTRLFSQVLHNSVYTYALVLVVFLVALALGATLANRLSRTATRAPRTMWALLMVSGLAVMASAVCFHAYTGGMGYVGTGLDWGPYMGTVALMACGVMLVPGMILGAVLPFALRLIQSAVTSPGRAVGRLLSINTTGAIIGSLAAGFLLIPAWGTFRTLFFLAATYFICAAGYSAAMRSAWRGLTRYVLPASAGVAGCISALLPVHQWLPLVYLNPAREEVLLEAREGAQASVAVIERDGFRLIRVNNHYTLGGTGALESERNQTIIPLLLHPAPRDVFFIGMGTGISAGAALLFPVERVIVCELVPDVIDLARKYFRPWTAGLFDDPRVRLLAADGRHVLHRSPRRYDVIISDLFTPWRAGVGNLYTLEHFKTAAAKLKPGGFFVQWIPTYQVSEQEFGIIARTMTDAFAQVVLWRGDLYPLKSIVALIGYPQPTALDPKVLVEHGRRLADKPFLSEALATALPLRFYAGNLSASGLFSDSPLNTDDRPYIEYLAPRTQRKVHAGRARWLTGDQLGILYERLLRNPGLDNDPYLAKLSERQRGYVLAGRSYFNYRIYRSAGNLERASRFLDDFLARTPFNRAPADPPPPETLSNWEER